MTASDARPPAQSWLAVIDMQRIFGDAGSPWAAPRFDEVVEPVARLVDAFGAQTVFTRFIAPAEPVGAWRAYYDAWPFAMQPADAPAYEIVPRFATMAGRTVDSTTFGKWTAELAALVGVDDRLVVCGVSTDCCVLSTVLAAADAGVETLVVSDACAGVDDESHVRALAVMSLYAPLVRIVTVDEVLGSFLVDT